LTRGLTHKLGICQWFHFEAHGDVERAVAEMRALGVSRLRTGISWADYHRAGGPAWYDWLFEALAGFELLVSVFYTPWHTPPSISERYTCASPPQRVTDYGSFVGLMIERYGHRFWDIELWNEPGSPYERDLRQCDPCLSRLGEMIAFAAEVAKGKGKRTVLGGMMPADHQWLELMRRQGALAHVDVVAVRGFPGTSPEISLDTSPNTSSDISSNTSRNTPGISPARDRQIRWLGWDEKIARIREHGDGKPIWITETGLATWDVHAERRGRYRLQADLLRRAAQAPAERVYWHSLIDIDPARDALDGFHVDENEYHLGLVSWEGERKPAWGIMKHLLADERTPLMAPPDPASAVIRPPA
jgi:CDP-paratose 2-epimerase